MLKALECHRARRAARDLIGPLLAASRQRLGAMPESVWRQPYMIGFISMLVSLSATETVARPLSLNELASVQVAAWADATGSHDASIGEAILVLSASANLEFAAGCSGARRFFAAACQGRGVADEDEIAGLLAGGYGSLGAAVETDLDARPPMSHAIVRDALWKSLFEDRIERPTLNSTNAE